MSTLLPSSSQRSIEVSGWEYHSTYRGIDIQVWMPDGTPFTAYFNDRWYMADSLSALHAAIDDFLAPVEIPTKTTISAPSRADPEESFNITGILTERDTGTPIPNQTIGLSYNGISLGSTTTGVDGDYLKAASIPNKGTYTLKASFAGKTGYAASEATRGLSIIPMTPLIAVVSIILPITVGLAAATLFGRR